MPGTNAGRGAQEQRRRRERGGGRRFPESTTNANGAAGVPTPTPMPTNGTNFHNQNIMQFPPTTGPNAPFHFNFYYGMDPRNGGTRFMEPSMGASQPAATYQYSGSFENVTIHAPMVASEPRPSVPVQTEDGLGKRNNVAPKCEADNSGKTFLEIDNDSFYPYHEVLLDIEDIVNMTYLELETWPKWEAVPPSQRDLWYKEFKEYYYWFPENERQMRKHFETELKSCLNKGKRPMEYEDEEEEEEEGGIEADNSGKTFLEKDNDSFYPYHEVITEIEYIIDRTYPESEPWPKWEAVPPSQRDLWYKEFKEYYYWLPENERQMRKHFETELKSCLNRGMRPMDEDEDEEEEEEEEEGIEGDNSEKTFLQPFFDEDRLYREVLMKLKDMIDSKYPETWPTWEAILPSQLDLWYKEFKKYYYWRPDNERLMRNLFEMELQNLLRWQIEDLNERRRRFVRKNVAPNWEGENSEKAFLEPYKDVFYPYCEAYATIREIINNTYPRAWPTWESVSPSQRDLWYKEFKEYYYWLPENERQMRKNFETELESCFKDVVRNPGKKPMEHEKGIEQVNTIGSIPVNERRCRSEGRTKNREGYTGEQFQDASLSKTDPSDEANLGGILNKENVEKFLEMKAMKAYKQISAAKEAKHKHEWKKQKSSLKELSKFFKAHKAESSRQGEEASEHESKKQKKALKELRKFLKTQLWHIRGEESSSEDDDSDPFSDTDNSSE